MNMKKALPPCEAVKLCLRDGEEERLVLKLRFRRVTKAIVIFVVGARGICQEVQSRLVLWIPARAAVEIGVLMGLLPLQVSEILCEEGLHELAAGHLQNGLPRVCRERWVSTVRQ